MNAIKNPLSSIVSSIGSGGGGDSGGSSPFSALKGLGGGGMATLLDPLNALGDAVFGDSFLKYLLMPHTIITDAVSGGLSGGSSGSSSGVATLLGSSGTSNSA